jgi:hypothetical protein
MPPGGLPQPGVGYGPVGPASSPVVIDIGQTAGRQAVVGSVVAGAVGMVAIYAGLAGQVDGGGEAVAVVIGVLFLLPAVLTIAFSKQVFRPRKLVFEPGGIRWDDPRGAPWAVAWHELGAVSISKHSPLDLPQTVNDRIVSAATDKMLGERAHVRIDLFPADRGFPERHPQMAPLWGRQGVAGGYRLPLGNKAQLVPVIDQAMTRFAPGIYRGVVATEGFMGLT